MTQNRNLPAKFTSNGYRGMSEHMSEHENIPYGSNHSRPAPFYTDPYTNSLPPQGLEPRSNPYATREVDMINTNASGFNAPFGNMRMDSAKKEESRWWDWTQPKAEPYGSGAKIQDERPKIRESSYRNAFNFPSEPGVYAKRNSRYSASPHHIRAVGIVPITDLKSDDLESVNQKFIEKVSYEQQYNNGNPANYSLPGKRYGTVAVEEMKPSSKPIDRSQLMSSAKVERAASMWDLFHPHLNTAEQMPNNSRKYRPPLPEIKRTEKYDGNRQNAPYGYDFQVDQAYHQPPVINQMNID